MDAGKWLAEDRGAFEQIEPSQLPVEVPAVPTRYPIAERLTAQELLLLLEFRNSLPSL